MYEYKSEVLRVNQASKKGIKIVSSMVDHVDTAKLDSLINKRAEEGWELVTYCAMVDNFVARVNVIITFRKPK